MSKAKKEEKAKTSMAHETCCCPFCQSSRLWQKTREDYSGFFVHLRNARVEVLRALKCIIEDRITSLEQGKKKVTKIKVD